MKDSKRVRTPLRLCARQAISASAVRLGQRAGYRTLELGPLAALAVCRNASVESPVMANETTTGVTNAPVSTSRLRVARLLSSMPSNAASTCVSLSAMVGPLWNITSYKEY